MDMNVVDFAYQVIDMHEELIRLRVENEDLRKYQKL